jgi:hypothetical protein
MKKTLLLITFVLVGAFSALAMPVACTSESLADYVALTAGCTIGDITFDDFQYTPTSFMGAPVPPAGSVMVNPQTGTEAGFEFVAGWSAGAGQFEDSLITYTATCMGCLLDDWVLQTGGAGSAGLAADGVVNVTETSSQIPGALTQVTVGAGPVTGVGSATFPPVASVTVSKDIFVYGASALSTQVSSVTNLFSSIATPEPSLLILCAGFLGLVPVARRKFGL